MKWWVFLPLLTGCVTQKPIIERVVEKDTVIVTRERILHDTLEIRKDTIIYQDSVIVQLRYVDNKIIVSAKCPAQEIKVKTKTLILKPRETFRDRIEKGLLWLFGVALIILLGKKLLERLF